MLDYTAIMKPYQNKTGGILQAYHAVQKEINYLPQEAIIAASQVFGIPAKEAYGVATFYSYFSTKPRGKYVIRMCQSAPCHIAGAAQVIAALEDELGIKVGETTKDGKFTLELTECVGQCQQTPGITINNKPYGGLTAEKIPGILASLD